MRVRRLLSVLSLLLASTACVQAQSSNTVLLPKVMRICVTSYTCLRLQVEGSRYIGRVERTGVLDGEFFVLAWNKISVHLYDRDFKVKGREFDMVGTIAPDGASVLDGKGAVVNGPGGFTFTIQWDKSEGNMQAVTLADKNALPPMPHVATMAEMLNLMINGTPDQAVYGTQQWSISKTHPELVIPPMASEGFMSFPDDYRAILQPGRDQYSKLMLLTVFTKSCAEAASETNPSAALEIGKFAIRALDYDRGLCWLMRADALHHPGAAPLLGIANLEGWGVPKNPAEGFRTFTVRNDAWSLYFREQCYLKGIGTSPNQDEAKKLDLKLQASLSGEYLLESIGLDKVENQRHAFEAQLETHPPTKPVSICRQPFQNEIVPANQRGDNGDVCTTSSVVDQEALKRALATFQPGEPQICTTDMLGIQTCQ